jgi:SAM-dependent methyltransferase
MGGPTADVTDRLLAGILGFVDLLAVALGDRLGYYRGLADHPGQSSQELAEATGTAERYAREWLEQQAVTGLLEADGAPDAKGRRFRLAPGAAEVLAAPDSLATLAPLARQLAAAARQLPAVADAFRSGGGVPWTAYGVDMRESQGEMNRPGFRRLLPEEWLAALPDVRRRLRGRPPARVADVGCGAGWSSIGIAAGYPEIVVDGYDTDAASIGLARGNVAEAGLADRVRMRCQDIGEVTGEPPYDLVMAFECVHDMPDPVGALGAMRRLAGDDGTVLIADMKVAERFTAPGDEVERLMYGFSVFICLPDSMSTPGSAATGTVMRESTLRGYADLAGFGEVTVLPVAHALWRFYRLAPRPDSGAVDARGTRPGRPWVSPGGPWPTGGPAPRDGRRCPTPPRPPPGDRPRDCG